MSWHVYLLSCADGTLYCGVTNDLSRRLAEHNGELPGAGAKYTRARRPVLLAACAPCADKSAALRLELAVKKRPRAAKLAYLLEQPGARTPEPVPTEALQTEALQLKDLQPEATQAAALQAETSRSAELQPEAIRPGKVRAKKARPAGVRAAADTETSAQTAALPTKECAS